MTEKTIQIIARFLESAHKNIEKGGMPFHCEKIPYCKGLFAVVSTSKIPGSHLYYEPYVKLAYSAFTVPLFEDELIELTYVETGDVFDVEFYFNDSYDDIAERLVSMAKLAMKGIKKGILHTWKGEE